MSYRFFWVGMSVFLIGVAALMAWDASVDRTQYWRGDGNFNTDVAECSAMAGDSVSEFGANPVLWRMTFDHCMIGREWVKLPAGVI